MNEVYKFLIGYLESLKESGISQLYQKADANLTTLSKKYCSCRKCELATTRKNFVYGQGNQKSRVVIIGEAPGANEDKLGLPFVGRAGELLTKMLASINIQREDIYITNIVKCRPPKNRDPKPNEVKSCLPYLVEQLTIIKPKVLFLLGRVSAQSLLGQNLTISRFREESLSFMGIKVFVTYHPAALLRNPNFKKAAWVDLQRLQNFLANR